MKYKNPPQKPPTMKRESPQDFMKAFSEFIKKTGRKTLTPKAFAIIRGEKKSND